MNKKILISSIIIAVFGIVIAGYFTLQKSIADNQVQIFSTKEECEQTTGKKCDFVMCDYLPKGVTCGENFKGKGWHPIEPQQQKEINDRCKLEPETGSCKARFIRYYFDQEEDLCKEFIWGGCEGIVPFETLGECQEVCGNGQ